VDHLANGQQGATPFDAKSQDCIEVYENDGDSTSHLIGEHYKHEFMDLISISSLLDVHLVHYDPI